MFKMKNFTGQKFGLIIKGWTSVIELRNFIHNFVYTESSLRKMNLSNGRCHLCKESSFQEDLQHLFF